MVLSPESIKVHSPSGTAYPKQLQDSIMRWAAVYAKFGGQEAFPHAKRVLDSTIDYGIIPIAKGGRGCDDRKQLGLKLANVILAHVFRRGKDVMAHFPTQDFGKHQLVVEGFKNFDALRENDLGDQDSNTYIKLLQTPSLGILARMVDLTQYGQDRYTSEHELSHLDPRIFYVFEPGRGKDEYHNIAIAAQRIYSPIADFHGYRELSGDLLKIAYYQLKPELHGHVEYAIEYVRDCIQRTQQLLADLKPHLEAELASRGFTFQMITRSEKNHGKVMEKVDRHLRKDDVEASVDNVVDRVSALHDMVAFKVIVNTKDKRPVTQNDIATFKEVASLIIGLTHSLQPLTRTRTDGISTDMISKPKPNGHQSLNVDMTFRNPKFIGLEAIICNPRMHNYSEYKGAAHYLYKNGGKEAQAVQKAFRDVIQSMERGRLSACDTSTAYRAITVAETRRGRKEEKTVFMHETAIVADVLVAAGKMDLENGYKLEPPLSLFDEIGRVRRLEITHISQKGQLLASTVGQLINKAELPATREALQKMLKKK